MFAIALYTGMRPNEYATAKLEGEFIVAVNSKRNSNKIEDKQIPVTPLLKPFLKGANKIEFLGNMLKMFTQKSLGFFA